MAYHFVYKTTNLATGKFYLGKHTTEVLDDGYLGSGVAITSAIKKYGKQNFRRDILVLCETEAEALEVERHCVSLRLGDPMCYNLVPGGKGFTTETATQASMAAQQSGWYGFKSMTKERLSEISQKGRVTAGIKLREQKLGMFGWTFEERSSWTSGRDADTKWITNGVDDIRIKIEDPIPEGFYAGRSIDGFKGRIGMNCWTDGKVNVFSELPPSPEFTQGMVKTTPTAKLPWWNNGKINKRTVNQPGDEFVPGRMEWTSKTVTCPHCAKIGGETAMKRHHFDHCKLRK
jgi:hypothetical protein